MGDLKPLGSEKLNGDEKLKRILELTYYKNNNKNSSQTKPELVKESTTGIFGIVKEKDGYYVKKGLNEQSLDYIGGMFMKNKNKFSSYAEALKRLELLRGQEDLQEATKYVLKPNKPQEEAPVAEPSLDLPPAPEVSSDVPSDVPAEEPSMDMPSAEGGEDENAGKRSSYMAEAQKYAGKLGQELRDLHDQMESDDIKYILNMIISAVDLDKLDDEDIEEIGKKFEREEEVGDEEPSAEVPAEEPAAEPAPEEVAEYDSMSALDEFINTPIESDEIDLSDYAIKEEGDVEEEEVKELDLDEIKNDINQAISEKLSKYFN
mgnify:CR=1 FL=1